ncbi:MAG TPA: outer membrane beta-barrel protein [Gammaproteobacteria bacterium]
MNRTLIASSLALMTLTFAHSAGALDVSPSGFVDMVWTLSDGTGLGKYGEEGRFDTSGEIDVEAGLKEGISMRFDADINPGSAGGDSGRLEQIFLNWAIDPKMSLKGGVFNNRLSWEREDAPDMYQITHGQLWDIWDASTFEDGNNLAGLEFSYQIDKVKLIAGVLNDLGDVPEENSVKIAGEIKAFENLDLTVGLVTQDQGVENIIDIHATWKSGKLLVGGEVLFADEIIDSGFMVMANYQFNDKFSGTARFDFVSYDSAFLAEDTSSVTVAALYSISKNLFANAEVRFNDDGNQTPADVVPPLVGEGDGTTARLELLATF